MNNIIKIILYNNERIVITSYNKLLEISSEIIKIDDFLIIGENLKIKKMDSYMIEILGKVEEVKNEK